VQQAEAGPTRLVRGAGVYGTQGGSFQDGKKYPRREAGFAGGVALIRLQIGADSHCCDLLWHDGIG